jgi:hypothetical protein
MRQVTKAHSSRHAVTEAAHTETHEWDDVDISALEESPAKSPWERMLANDDALNFGEALRAAMERRRA